jgi:hypothetical protein
MESIASCSSFAVSQLSFETLIQNGRPQRGLHSVHVELCNIPLGTAQRPLAGSRRSIFLRGCESHPHNFAVVHLLL